MSDCIFCKIADGTIPSKKIYENDRVLAFEDLNPVTPVHVLLIPKRHYRDIMAMAADEEGARDMAALLAAIPEVARLTGIAAEGFRLVNNCGEAGGQTVFHVHFHLIGGRKLSPDIL